MLYRSFITIVMVVAATSVATLAEEVPFEASWAASGHADASSEAFMHWGVEPNTVQTTCARCHSGTGFQDFIGADGSAVGVVDVAPLVGSTVDCTACHNTATISMHSVVFPSGAEVTDLGSEARCMQCHQGRESTISVDQKITDANVPDDDTVSSLLSFRNIHYFAAGATQYGGLVLGGYQYVGKSYDIKFAHVEGLDTCNSCHDPHSLEIKTDICAGCHVGVATKEDLKNIRFVGSASDYDGDKNVTEGIAAEIEGLKTILYSAIQAYASGTIGVPIKYVPSTHPYWFKNDGVTKYADWTARLVKATYNYQFSMKDPGGFAHNGKYVIQLLYDSIEDLNPARVTGLERNDAGHFAGSEEPFRHWDEDGEVSASCSKCHSAEGLPFYLETGITVAQEISNGFKCTTCHNAIPGYTRYQVDEVEFPSGAVLSLGDPNTGNLCISCHQGRESTVSVNAAIAGKALDTVDSSLKFKNSHYFPAGATLLGAEAKGAYEYMGKSYSGRTRHTEVPSVDSCTECHDTHTLKVKVQNCRFCHNVVTGPRDIRKDKTKDYDGDGSSSEPLVGEVETLQDDLYAAIQAYARNVAGVPIIYSTSHPYFFIDTNGNGNVDPGEDSSSNKYNAFTPRLIQGTYNYQYVMKDPGAYAHNASYIIQILYDSIADLGGDTTGMVRPGATNTSQECGDPTHPYPTGDLNLDCIVDFKDVAAICTHWMDDTNP